MLSIGVMTALMYPASSQYQNPVMSQVYRLVRTMNMELRRPIVKTSLGLMRTSKDRCRWRSFGLSRLPKEEETSVTTCENRTPYHRISVSALGLTRLKTASCICSCSGRRKVPLHHSAFDPLSHLWLFSAHIEVSSETCPTLSQQAHTLKLEPLTARTALQWTRSRPKRNKFPTPAGLSDTYNISLPRNPRSCL